MGFTISIIGSGNVGTHLAKQLAKKGHNIYQVYSQTLSRAETLAKAVNASPTNRLKDIANTVDILLLAVKDDAIEQVAKELTHINKPLVAHTSGATPIHIFENYFPNYGVFYPLQTFSIDKEVDFNKLPIIINGNSNGVIEILKKVSSSIVNDIVFLSDSQRAILHVCAVFVNNFTNHLVTISDDILSKENIPKHILLPLIMETIDKIQSNTAFDMQTGPARRDDQETIKKHINFLEIHPRYQAIYKLLSDSIAYTYAENKNSPI